MSSLKEFWKKRKVFITGHTGFKGSWLSLWLTRLGARVRGYSLEPPTEPSLYELCKVKEVGESIFGDIRDFNFLKKSITDFNPEVIIHMAAQPLVSASYRNPLATYSTNIMGTVNILEIVRCSSGIRVVLNVTTDKCYRNNEWVWGYRENEPLGGFDPYSNSKACSDLITTSYMDSFFNTKDYDKHNVGIATARAGNVIGGGDWATDRLIPDCIRSVSEKKVVELRYPGATRPWQYVLEPLSGYLLLARRLYQDGAAFSGSWNFGPEDSNVISVENLVKIFCEKWGDGASYIVNKNPVPHEAEILKLDCSKAKTKLNWQPKMYIDETVEKIVEWTKAYDDGQDLREICYRHISEYESN